MCTIQTHHKTGILTEVDIRIVQEGQPQKMPVPITFAFCKIDSYEDWLIFNRIGYNSVINFN